MTDNLDDFFLNDPIDAVDAKFEAQKIAFAPYAFQSALTLRNLGILECLYKSKEKGMSIGEISEETGLSDYGLGVLLNFGLSMEIIKLKSDLKDVRYKLGKIGFFILKDELTRVNMNFMNDLCYTAANQLEESILCGKPKGLETFGDWKTIYEGLSELPEKPQKSWFAFDHFYSDNAFSEALPVVFNKKVRKIMDIGGNTARWAIACTKYDPHVEVTIVDLPKQTKMAHENILKAGLEKRVHTYSHDVLADSSHFPKGHDVVWMSQFLDCFGSDEITEILSKIRKSINDDCDVFVLEPLWDKQKYKASAYSLHATSLYFTVMANGNSKMYSCKELVTAVEKAGFIIKDETHRLGPFDYSLLRFRKAVS